MNQEDEIITGKFVDPRKQEIEDTTTSFYNPAIKEFGAHFPLTFAIYNQIRYFEDHGKLSLGYSVAGVDFYAKQFKKTTKQVQKAFDNLTNKYQLGSWVICDEKIFRNVKKIWVSNVRQARGTMAEALEVGAVLLDENSYSVGDDAKNSYGVGANREKLLQRRSKTPTVEELRTEVPPLSESNKKVITKISSDLEDDEGETPIIPLAAPTTQFVEVETFDSDDNGKTIVVERRIPRKSWNSAVKIWRNDESKFARVEFEDEPGKMTSIRPSQLKSWNVRPKIGGSVNQYNGGTAFQG